MKNYLAYKAPLLFLAGLLLLVVGALSNSMVLAVIGGVLLGTGICFLRTVNPDLPPPPPPKNPNNQK